MSDLTKDLGIAICLIETIKEGAPTATQKRIYDFIRTHHATIQQNAEDAKRLRAMERAMGEYVEKYPYGWAYSAIRWVTKRADEILREGEGM